MTMGEILDDFHAKHKERQLRIKNAAFKDVTKEQSISLGLRKSPTNSIEIIMFEVCRYYKVRPSDILSQRRLNNISLPRHITYYLICRLTPLTFNQIARMMHKDPSSVYYGFKRVERELAKHQSDLTTLEEKLSTILPSLSIKLEE